MRSGVDPVVRVENLSVRLSSGEPVVEDVSFTIDRAEILGLIGESGCGKTTTALSLLGYTRAGVEISGGRIEVAGESILGRDPRAMRSLRGRVVSYVPQDPGGSLNPSLRVGDTILDVLRAHRSVAVPRESVRAALQRVELGADPQFTNRYPHQLSGGQQQRVTIAMASACQPPVAVLDEPTTGLDVLTQEKILLELRRLREQDGMTMIYVSHDLAVVAGMADRIVVMYAGRVVESGPASEVIEHPKHPYTRALVSAIPDLRRPRSLRGIPGVCAGVGEWPPGCAFADRCEFTEPRCEEALPPLEETSPGHVTRCVRWQELNLEDPTGAGTLAVRRLEPAPLLEVSHLEAAYRHGRSRRTAVEGISFSVARGECVALVGESGSGKTTVGRCIAGLHAPTDGSIVFDGRELAGAARSRPLEPRRRIQIIFQNPFESLNPRHRVASSIERPLRVLRGLSRTDAEREVGQLLERVRLPKRLATRYPGELSGGERQRVAIARALGAKPDLLICDEVTSALDVSVQAAVIELLQELQRDLRLSMLFITHNLGLVASIADSVLVMEHGSLCESGTVTEVLTMPSHDYTRRLLSAAPSLPEAAVG